MKKGIIIFTSLVLLLTINSVSAQEKIEMQTIYSVVAEIYRNDTVILEDIRADKGLVSSFPTMETGYFVKVLSFDDEELFKANLGVSFTINLEEVGKIELNSTSVHLRVPYYHSAKKIIIYRSTKEILTIDLSEEICNKNQVCDIGENVHNCQDCPSGGKDGYCDGIRDLKCDPDCEIPEDMDCPKTDGTDGQVQPTFPSLPGGDTLLWIIVIVIVVAILGILVLRKRKSKSPSKSEDWEGLYKRYR